MTQMLFVKQIVIQDYQKSSIKIEMHSIKNVNI